MEIYKKRRIQFNGIHTANGWHIKSYSIVYDTKSFSIELENESFKLLKTDLPKITESVYGLGFMITHHGKDSNFVLLDWWCNENELQHQVYYSTKKSPEKLKKQDRSFPIACVWDLIIINHERNAWVKDIMTKQSDKSNYLKNYIHGKF